MGHFKAKCEILIPEANVEAFMIDWTARHPRLALERALDLERVLAIPVPKPATKPAPPKRYPRPKKPKRLSKYVHPPWAKWGCVLRRP